MSIGLWRVDAERVETTIHDSLEDMPELQQHVALMLMGPGSAWAEIKSTTFPRFFVMSDLGEPKALAQAMEIFNLEGCIPEHERSVDDVSVWNVPCCKRHEWTFVLSEWVVTDDGPNLQDITH